MNRYKKLSICKVAAPGRCGTSGRPFQASAGCQHGGGLVEKMCDGPIQDDGIWQRCVTQHTQDVINRVTCQMMGPGQNPLGLAYYNPPTHIDA